MQARENEPTGTANKESWWLRNAYKRYFANIMENGMEEYEKKIAKKKKELFGTLRDDGKGLDILEIGIGAAPNIGYYPRNSRIVGIEPNEFMDDFARKKALSLQTKGIELTIKRGFSEALPVPDDSFDVVVSTITLCSVKDQMQSLHEIARVLKPGGVFIFIEHVVSKESLLLRIFQNLFNALQIVLLDGCHLTRDTASAIQSVSSFRSVAIDHFLLPNASLISPHIAGTAIKGALSSLPITQQAD